MVLPSLLRGEIQWLANWYLPPKPLWVKALVRCRWPSCFLSLFPREASYTVLDPWEGLSCRLPVQVSLSEKNPFLAILDSLGHSLQASNLSVL